MARVSSVCALHRYHAPRPNRYVHHHIVPQMWGGKSVPGNLALVCDTGHYSVHILLDEYVRRGGDPGWVTRRNFAPSERIMARRAWDGRPSDDPPPTLPRMIA